MIQGKPSSLVLAAALVMQAAAAPNIIFFLSDDHAPHAISSLRPHLPAYGGHIANPTPNIDRLADAGVMFSNTFCENSICGPSRAAILTGKFSHLHGYLGNQPGLGSFNPAQRNLAAMLRDGGYDTGLFGKWHLRVDPLGFNTYAFHDSASQQGNYYQPVYRAPSGNFTTPRGTYCSDFTADLSLDWLGGSVNLGGTPHTRDPGKPFALFCHFKAPHRPWIPGPAELGLWRDFEGDPAPDTGLDPTWGEPATLQEAAASWPGRSDVLDRNRMTIQSHQ